MAICLLVCTSRRWTRSRHDLDKRPSCAEYKWSRWVGSWAGAKRAGVERLVINGSFVTDLPEPNDVDCVLLFGSDFPRDAEAEQELLNGLPFLEIQLVRQERFTMLVERFFATDRKWVPKGMVEVIL